MLRPGPLRHPRGRRDSHCLPRPLPPPRRYLPRADLRYDQPAALGALLRLDAHIGTHHADRFTEPDGLWDQWVNALPHLRDHPAYTPAEQRRWTDLLCDFAEGWARP
ncbi:DUF6000 family protein [Streptomyces sp. GMY02]|uniref:DUF6000 family protein n=1 Tax=Streptomyces sp. GMY02 TaxID=1333528 RepID=UPI0020B7E232|nr:DUF6000 family protein [Streptomyces sp. GMY02]